MTELANFRLAVNPLGVQSLEVNGEDVTATVAGVTLDATPGQTPVLGVFHVPGAGVIEGQAVIEGAAGAVSWADFLDSLNPEEVEAKALADSGFDESIAAAILRHLRTLVPGG